MNTQTDKAKSAYKAISRKQDDHIANCMTCQHAQGSSEWCKTGKNLEDRRVKALHALPEPDMY